MPLGGTDVSSGPPQFFIILCLFNSFIQLFLSWQESKTERNGQKQ